MRAIIKGLKKVVLTIIVLVLIIIVPVGANKLYNTIRAKFLSEQEKQLEDLSRLSYLFEYEFAGYDVLSTTSDFKRELNRLKRQLEQDSLLNDTSFKMAVIKLVSTFKDPHTSVFNINEIVDTRFPYALSFYEGDFYLTAGTIEKEWLGSKVLSIGGIDGEQVYNRLSAYANAPNEAGLAFFIRRYLASPDVLYEEVIISQKDSIDLQFSLNGEVKTVTFKSLPYESVATMPDYITIKEKFTSSKLPLSQLNPHQNYWFKYLESEDMIYLRYKLCVDQGDAEHFWNNLFKHLDSILPEKFVIDVRGNPGGDTQTHVSFIHKLKTDTTVNKYGHLFTLIDRGTGSAAVSFTSDMERLTNTILVGEKTMDAPNTTSDPTFYTLPHSDIQIMLPSLYSLHSYVEDSRTSISPHIEIPENIYANAYLVDEVLDSVKKMKIPSTSMIFGQLPKQVEDKYAFSTIRNFNIYQEDLKWYSSIDGLMKAPIFQKDSSLVTTMYNMKFDIKDSSNTDLAIRLHQKEWTYRKLTRLNLAYLNY